MFILLEIADSSDKDEILSEVLDTDNSDDLVHVPLIDDQQPPTRYDSEVFENEHSFIEINQPHIAHQSMDNFAADSVSSLLLHNLFIDVLYVYSPISNGPPRYKVHVQYCWSLLIQLSQLKLYILRYYYPLSLCM